LLLYSSHLPLGVPNGLVINQQLVDYSLITLEASMAMKKTSGGDSPLRQVAGKSFWTLPISGRRRRWIVMCFWKSDRVFRFFPSGGLYR
jgi:hypothetical protein